MQMLQMLVLPSHLTSPQVHTGVRIWTVNRIQAEDSTISQTKEWENNVPPNHTGQHLAMYILLLEFESDNKKLSL